MSGHKNSFVSLLVLVGAMVGLAWSVQLISDQAKVTIISIAMVSVEPVVVMLLYFMAVSDFETATDSSAKGELEKLIARKRARWQSTGK